MTKRSKKPSNVVLPELQKPEPALVAVAAVKSVDADILLRELYARFAVVRAEGKVDELIAVIDEITKLGGTIPVEAEPE